MGPRIEGLTKIGLAIKKGFKQAADRLGGRSPEAERFALKVLTNPDKITPGDIEDFKNTKSKTSRKGYRI